MRLTAPFLALALALALAPLPGAAQASGGAPAQESAVERVADLARLAMGAPHASTAWSALARALPEMALAEGASLEETFEAARIADSLALSAEGPLPALAPGVVTTPRSLLPEPGARPGAAREGEVDPSDPAVAAGPVDVFPTGAAVLVMVGVGASALAWLRLRARGTRAAAPAPQPSRRGRAWTARELGRGSEDLAEVARRTGMTREAVALALRLEGGGRAA